MTSTYSAAHTVLASLPEPSAAVPPAGRTSFAQIPVFATTGEVPKRRSPRNWITTAPAALAAQVTVEADSETGTIRFTTAAGWRRGRRQDRRRLRRRDHPLSLPASRRPAPGAPDNALADVERLEAELDELDQQVADELAHLAADLPEDAPAAGSRLRARGRNGTPPGVEYCVAYEAYRSLLTEEPDDLTLTTLERAQPVRSRFRWVHRRRVRGPPGCRSPPASAPCSALAWRCWPSAWTPRCGTGARPRRRSAPGSSPSFRP